LQACDHDNAAAGRTWSLPRHRLDFLLRAHGSTGRTFPLLSIHISLHANRSDLLTRTPLTSFYMHMIGRDKGNRRRLRTAAIAMREEVARFFRVVHDNIPSPRPSRKRIARLLPKRSAPIRAPLDKAGCSGVTSNVISWAIKTPAG
jgi:hypothetical protein